MMILNKFQKLKQKNRYMNNKERIQKVILTFQYFLMEIINNNL